VFSGGVTSLIQVTVRDVVAVLPQQSVATHVLVCDLLQPLLIIAPSVGTLDCRQQLSVAVAVPNAIEISVADGLHPSVIVLKLLIN